ncbi:MAG: iron-sulfur cluster assembly accessory protein [Bacteroidia bacterium]|nr:iron-sulfur cluster assembly accessory protein [Bacteroidia bacterium]
METINQETTPLAFSERAIAEIKAIRQQQQLSDDYFLRVGVQGGGCSGMSYVLGFDKKKETDTEFVVEGETIIMDKRHGIYILGMYVDFQDGLNARGFTFSNPNAKSTCGCGSSFSV